MLTVRDNTSQPTAVCEPRNESMEKIHGDTNTLLFESCNMLTKILNLTTGGENGVFEPNSDSYGGILGQAEIARQFAYYIRDHLEVLTRILIDQ